MLAGVGVHLGLRPIKRLRDEVAERLLLDLRSIFDSTAPREIAPVALTLNWLFALLRGTAHSQHAAQTPKDRLVTMQDGAISGFPGQ